MLLEKYKSKEGDEGYAIVATTLDEALMLGGMRNSFFNHGCKYGGFDGKSFKIDKVESNLATRLFILTGKGKLE
jgi:hypothetical protein